MTQGSNLETLTLTVLSVELTLSFVEMERWKRGPLNETCHSSHPPNYVDSY